MTTLHDRLAELAHEAPPGGPQPDLWVQGRRVHRRRQAGTIAIIAVTVLALGALGTTSWLRSRQEPLPADPGVGAGLPNRLYQPSPWLDGTDEAGELGRVAVMIPAERKSWSGSRTAFVGVSALTGEYRFLDLPDFADAGGPSGELVSLSPDGRHVAYWLTGKTAESPNRDSGPTTGIAIYDAATGEVRRHWIATKHGLMPDVLLWADAETLVFGYGDYNGGVGDPLMAQSSGKFGPTWAWRVDQDAPTVVGQVARGADIVDAAGGRILVSADGAGEYRIVDLDGREPDRDVRIAANTSGRPALSASGQQVAVVSGKSRQPGISGKNPNVVLAGDPESGLVHVPDSQRTFAVYSWTDDKHIVVLKRARPGGMRAVVDEVEVATGKAAELVDVHALEVGFDRQFATDLFAAPTKPAVAPPRPLDPREVAALGGGFVLVGLGALVLWRRRVRP